ncbi:MAG: manganese efflux pump [Chloroflexi bacterium]|jgi:putative Mn2+ efflux pump MntP|nr:manganese efflux pump [Chloroflexota bacterium]
MTLANVLLIALGLAMDSFSVSICSGAMCGRVDLKQALRVGFTMGGFQAMMPVIGWAAASLLASYVQRFDHWIAFGLLALIGGKMLWEALRGDGECEFLMLDSWRMLALLGVATSIDALAVGISFAFLGAGIAMPAAVIGVVCLALSITGVYLGRRAGDWLREWTPAVGGVVLIAMGVRILIEHLSAAAA